MTSSEQFPVSDGVYQAVTEALVGAISVDVDEVVSDATLVRDLGAESIDFLDVTFRLEKRFKIELPRDDLFPDDILTNAAFAEIDEATGVLTGRVNAAGIAELKKRMPFANLSAFEENPRKMDFGDLLTVGDLCRYVQSKIDAKS